MNDEDTLLKVEGLSVNFPTDNGIARVVRDVSFVVQPGEILGIVGESGCGKTMTALAIMGLLDRKAAISGSVIHRGQELVGLDEKRLRRYRGNSLAIIFQDAMSALHPVHTIGWQIAEAYRAHNAVSGKAALAKAVEVLDLVDFPHPLTAIDRYPHEFSGGMRQRAMIAMAMVNQPDLIIADEPTTALDATIQAQILETLLKIRESAGTAIIMITHDLGVLARIADRVQVMYAGTILETGSTDEIFYRSKMPYTRALLAANPHLEPTGKRLSVIPGTPPILTELPPGCSFAPRCPLVIDKCVAREPALTPSDSVDHLTRCCRWDEL